MSINIRTFGARKLQSNTRDQADERPKAQFWLNFGYISDVQDEDGTYRFVSLVTGVPLDTLEDLPVNSRNRSYAQFNQARNELRDDMLTEARKLAPGEDVCGTEEHGVLTYQIRRVAEENAAPTGENPFLRK